MKSNDPEYTDAALEVVRKYDEAAYRQMAGDDTWTVHVVTSPDDPMLAGDPQAQVRLFDGSGTAVTFSSGYGTPLYTLLGTVSEAIAAGQAGVSVAENVASDLIHEYRHFHYGEGEPGAYAAGSPSTASCRTGRTW